MSDTIAPFRLALRREGEWWNAYCAKIGTMDGATLMGSIRMSIVESNEARKQGFMDLMVAALDDMVLAITGVRAEKWEARDAPEHERAGRG